MTNAVTSQETAIFRSMKFTDISQFTLYIPFNATFSEWSLKLVGYSVILSVWESENGCQLKTVVFLNVTPCILVYIY
jgi:hypothetical protein